MKHLNRRNVFATIALAVTMGLAACGADSGSSGRSAIERDDDMAIGNPDAAVTIVEFASLTCPHCATFHNGIYKDIKSKYIETGKVRFVFRQFPTPPVRLAVGGEAIARCKADVDKYFAMIDVLFEKQMYWVRSQNPGQALRELAATAGISPEEFETCLADPQNITRIQEVSKHASETWGINSTPSFVINGELAQNMRSFDDFAKIIDPILAASDE